MRRRSRLIAKRRGPPVQPRKLPRLLRPVSRPWLRLTVMPLLPGPRLRPVLPVRRPGPWPSVPAGPHAGALAERPAGAHAGTLAERVPTRQHAGALAERSCPFAGRGFGRKVLPMFRLVGCWTERIGVFVRPMLRVGVVVRPKLCGGRRALNVVRRCHALDVVRRRHALNVAGRRRALDVTRGRNRPLHVTRRRRALDVARGRRALDGACRRSPRRRDVFLLLLRGGKVDGHAALRRRRGLRHRRRRCLSGQRDRQRRYH